MRFALVLGSGGARGFAHIGVIKVLQQKGLKPDLIVGSSIGAIIGGLYALNPEPNWLLKKANLFVRNKEFLKLLRLGFRQPALINTSKLQAFLDRLFNTNTFDDCHISFKALATDLITEKSIVIDKGLLSPAVLASSSIPGLMPPVKSNNKLLVDAGLTNPVPIDIAIANGFKNIIAVDLTPYKEKGLGKNLSMYHILLASLHVMIKTITLERLKAYQSRARIRIIRPFINKPFNFLRFDKALQAINQGEKAAVSMLKDY